MESSASPDPNVAVGRGNDGTVEGHEVERETEVKIMRQPSGTAGGEEEEVCGVCLELPEPGCFVELWCCGNVLCVNDAQQIGKCPFCREEPLVWNIVK